MCSGNSFKRFAKTKGTTGEITFASQLPYCLLQQRGRRTALLLLRFGCSCNPLRRMFAGTAEKLADR